MRGKLAFKANYWRCVLVGVIATALTGAMAATSSYRNNKVEGMDELGRLDSGTVAIIAGVAAIAVLFAVAVVLAFEILLVNPLMVGCDNFFLQNSRDSEANLSALERGFKPSYKSIVIAMFMKNLFIALWTLLLVVPGIVKGYQYRFVSYLLAENPEMDYREALETSKNLMNGHKWNAFVLDLSFIGWYLLAGLTLGILSVFYVNPYVHATNAELYYAIAHPELAQAAAAPADDSRTVEFDIQ